MCSTVFKESLLASLAHQGDVDKDLFSASCAYRCEVLIDECRAELATICSAVVPSIAERTKAEYGRTAKLLFERADSDSRYGGDLAKVIGDTRKSNTFYKRMASVKYLMSEELRYAQETYQREIDDPFDSDTFGWLDQTLRKLVVRIRNASWAAATGLSGPRSRRSSKKTAIPGLPKDWREQMCEQASSGRYAKVFPVAALTGCRPAELSGIEAWIESDAATNVELLRLKVLGVKVKSGQGQAFRILDYPVDLSSPIIRSLVETVRSSSQHRYIVEIWSGENFSAEVRRLGGLLWPKHHSRLSAYCFRHQFSADLKKIADSVFVSKSLGHQSTKTKKSYAKRGQARSMLIPVRVTVPEPVRHIAAPSPPSLWRKNDSGLEPI
jgi:integrase